MKSILHLAVLACVVAGAGVVNAGAAGVPEKIRLTISGGHETDPRDHGRPVVLIGNALGVAPEVFREAFSRVRPAPAGTEPDGERVRQNKEALMGALSKYGVTNDRLDEVSNYYRYQPGRGRLWKVSDAEAEATLVDGMVQSIKVLKVGSGYSSAPQVSVPGHPEIALQAKVVYGKDLRSNGSIREIAVVESKR